MPYAVRRLSRLRRHTDPRMLVERQHIAVVEYHIEGVEIAREAAHFDVIALSDNDDMVAIACQRHDSAVGDAHKRTGRFHDGQAECAGLRQRPIRGAVRGHHQRGCAHV